MPATRAGRASRRTWLTIRASCGRAARRSARPGRAGLSSFRCAGPHHLFEDERVLAVMRENVSTSAPVGAPDAGRAPGVRGGRRGGSRAPAGDLRVGIRRRPPAGPQLASRSRGRNPRAAKSRISGGAAPLRSRETRSSGASVFSTSARYAVGRSGRAGGAQPRAGGTGRTSPARPRPRRRDGRQRTAVDRHADAPALPSVSRNVRAPRIAGDARARTSR